MHEESAITPVSPTPTLVASFARSDTNTSKRAWDGALPFDEPVQLCKSLAYSRYLDKSPRLRNCHDDQVLPDAPRIALDSCQIVSYCLEDLDTPSMNKLDEKLWGAVLSPDIKSLSRQLTFDRRIVVTEDASLHLLWTDNIIYMKPLPAYITSYAFWQYLVDPSNDAINPEERERLVATSLGFLRTYASLIRHRSDFNLACRNDLLSSFTTITFETFTKFITPFSTLPSKCVSPRWRYGELNLDALNFHSFIHLHRWHLNRFESNHGAYFQRFFPSVLFMYALFSVILSAMQVVIGGRQMWDTENKGLRRALGLFEWFSCEAIGWSLSFGVLFVVWWICITTAEAWKRRGAKKWVKRRQKEEEAINP